MTKPSALMGTSEAREMLGVSKDTLIRMIARGVIRTVGKLPGPNGAYLFDRAEVERHKAETDASTDSRITRTA